LALEKEVSLLDRDHQLREVAVARDPAELLLGLEHPGRGPAFAHVPVLPASHVALYLSGVRHEFVNADGIRTHLALSGPEDAPPIMLVHGWPQNWWAWRHVIPTLAERFRVIAPDLRGHG
jgi:hypothetical protein